MAASSIIDPATGRPAQLPAAARARRVNMSAFEAADVAGQDLGSWLPAVYSPDAAMGFDRPAILARLHDLVRNDGWAAGTVASTVNAAVGPNLRLSSKPDYRALGISFEQATELGRQIEMLWRGYCNDPRHYCDARRQTTMGGLFYKGFRSRIVAGETIMLPLWRPVPGFDYATCFDVLDPQRLSNPNDGFDTEYLRSGVAIDDFGAAVGYHFRKGHPGDFGAILGAELYEWEYVEREWPWGRPQVIHYFRPDEAEATRGLSPLTPIVRRLKMMGRWESAEVQAAVANAVLAAYLETSLPPDVAADVLDDKAKRDSLNDDRLDFYEAAPISLSGFRIPIVPAGDRINFATPQRPNREAGNFAKLSLRYLAAATGLNPSTISRDYSETNYSSERAAMVEAWKTITVERVFFGQGTATPALACFLEEAIDIGRLRLPPGAPAFWEAPAAYLRGEWIGAGRGWVDPLKEAQASGERVDNLLSTLEREHAEQGSDWEEDIEQRGREQAKLREVGVEPAERRPIVTPQDREEDRS
ncbi:MAG: phage portal protein [Kiloniellaceae bacterium]